MSNPVVHLASRGHIERHYLRLTYQWAEENNRTDDTLIVLNKLRENEHNGQNIFRKKLTTLDKFLKF